MNPAEEISSHPQQVPAPPVAPPQYVQPAVTAANDPRRKSPALACFLSTMPGLGQVYVGYYQRGFIHAIVVASLIAFLAAMGAAAFTPLIPLTGIFLAFFFFYNIIDAGRRASLYNQALAGAENIEPPEDLKFPGLGGSIFGGVSLLVLGFLLLLHTRLGMSLEWVEDWWPLIVMGFGAYLLFKALSERKASDKSGTNYGD